MRQTLTKETKEGFVFSVILHASCFAMATFENIIQYSL